MLGADVPLPLGIDRRSRLSSATGCADTGEMVFNTDNSLFSATSLSSLDLVISDAGGFDTDDPLPTSELEPTLNVGRPFSLAGTTLPPRRTVPSIFAVPARFPAAEVIISPAPSRTFSRLRLRLLLLALLFAEVVSSLLARRTWPCARGRGWTLGGARTGDGSSFDADVGLAAAAEDGDSDDEELEA